MATNSSILAAFERMWQHIVSALATKADTNHKHNDIYYKDEIDTILNQSSQIQFITWEEND